MSFFNKINTGIDKIGKVTNDVMNKTSIKIDIVKQKAKLNDVFRDIGEIVYNANKTSENVTDKLNEYFEKVDLLNKQILVLEDEISKGKEKVCSNCFRKVPADANYCNICGNPINFKKQDIELEIKE